MDIRLPDKDDDGAWSVNLWYEQHELCAEYGIPWPTWREYSLHDKEQMMAARRLRLRRENVSWRESKDRGGPAPGPVGPGRPLTPAELEALGW